ncbi:hypothetical protein FB471_3228 [Amycolatopsis cihanbeyliensis]|uniref:Uncharacterized protein n=2 Tax=Amycolatopsis cihanbeyliensis TaxID=1128664 RepID=A0A542DK47_AMYCI|nr:RGCVC family protein [Amycolatopsis cihanbeyliensis]TQJ03467.1 hypothetical protein FB471_3228 [Amycolatopsis cihanbeyliensis]
MISDQLSTNADTAQSSAVNGGTQQRPGAAVRETAPSVPGTKSNPDGASEVACVVCPHSWSSHDQIATRYCTATVAGGYSRGCICTGNKAK